MIRTAVVCGFTALVIASAGARADGDPAAGKARSTTCAACHGVDGNSVNPEWPKLAGQHASYTVVQLQAYKDGKRNNVLMSSMAMGLDEQAQKDLAAYYAAQEPSGGTADPALVADGQEIYRGGNPKSGVSACTACHGPAGRGIPGAKIPVLAGQHATYTANQLRLYASGERQSGENAMMRNIAALMTEDEIKAVASYIEGLRKRGEM